MTLKFPVAVLLSLMPITLFADNATAPIAPPATTAATESIAQPIVIDCSTTLAKSAGPVDIALIEKWARQATVQSFTFDHTDIDSELNTLKTCYTEQGWQGFTDALNKSGNLNAIKSNQLVVSSQISGHAIATSLKDNQWKVTLPLDVVYQNKDNKIEQALSVDLIISPKPSGNLGIVQLIAIPAKKDTNSAAQSTNENHS